MINNNNQKTVDLAKEITERTEKVRIARAENASELAPLAQGF